MTDPYAAALEEIEEVYAQAAADEAKEKEQRARRIALEQAERRGFSSASSTYLHPSFEPLFEAGWRRFMEEYMPEHLAPKLTEFHEQIMTQVASAARRELKPEFGIVQDYTDIQRLRFRFTMERFEFQMIVDPQSLQDRYFPRQPGGTYKVG